VGRRAVAAADADSLSHHLESLTVSTDVACHIANMHGRVVTRADRESVLPLLSRFDMCFQLEDGGYVFPSLMPPTQSLPRWLIGAFCDGVSLEARRYVCTRDEDVVPPTLATLLMARVARMCPDVGLKPVMFGRGTVVMSCGTAGVVGVRLSDDDRAIDVFGLGKLRRELLGAATAHLAMIVKVNFKGLRLSKHALARVTDAERADPTLTEVQHPFFGLCRSDPLKTTGIAREQWEPVVPTWLACEYSELGLDDSAFDEWDRWWSDLLVEPQRLV
jgi:hypothetical protein